MQQPVTGNKFEQEWSNTDFLLSRFAENPQLYLEAVRSKVLISDNKVYF